jgi:hypothetical protein
MKPSEALAANLKAHFKQSGITAHTIGKGGEVLQKSVGSCLTGTVPPSINTVQEVCSAVGLDAMMIQLREYRSHQITHSIMVGRIADDLMELDIDQLKTIREMVKGLMPEQVSQYVPADLDLGGHDRSVKG